MGCNEPLRQPVTGAEAVLCSALKHGIDVCFANPGTTEMHFVGKIDSVPQMRAVLGLHETVCTGAADGYARMARRPALTLLHLGPGLANGIANLHNARRAGSPVLNLVGQMATWHRYADPLLNMDVEALAGTVSGFARTVSSTSSLMQDMQDAIHATITGGAVAGSQGLSRVATLFVPHDISWEAVPAELPSAKLPSAQQRQHTADSWQRENFMRSCAAALKQCPPNKAALYLGGHSLLQDGDALCNAGRIAEAVGADILCENAFARVDRGCGTPATLQRLPYFPQEAARQLARYELLVVVDARRPVAMFGYKDGPSRLMSLPELQVWDIDSASGVNIPAALQLLAEHVMSSNSSIAQVCNADTVFLMPPQRPPAMPTGKLTAAAVCAVVAGLQPEGAIIVDESLTSGATYWDASKGAPPFSHLTLTGGAIGCGPPLAVGAAIACPDRPVINLQADGSAMYSVQAMWTQAREGLKIITIICANRSYAILKVELARQKTGSMQGPAARSLTNLDRPTIDWVAIARGFGVHAEAVRTAEEFAVRLQEALHRDGPSLISAMIPQP